jgi:hypothetical protein
MPSRAQVEVPDVAIEREISLEEGFSRPLAEEYGTIVKDISTEQDLHRLLASQGVFLLLHLNPMLNKGGLRSALRNMTNPHKHEEPFWRPDSPVHSSARVLIPYVPQYGYMQDEENHINQPLRMSFGLTRQADKIRVARANVWVTSDGNDNSGKQRYKIVKDVNSYAEFDDQTEANNFLNSLRRRRSRIGFVLDRILEDLE